MHGRLVESCRAPLPGGGCELLGCTDSTAANYAAYANADDRLRQIPIDLFLQTEPPVSFDGLFAREAFDGIQREQPTHEVKRRRRERVARR